MGWVMLAVAALAAALVLVLAGYPRKLWTVAATALTLGAAGYAWQGSPALPGHPVAAGAKKGQVDPALVDLRDAMFGKYGTYAWSYANLADGMVRAGNSDLALGVWLGGVRKAPQEVALWTGFGTALAERDGQISPAAQFAFDKALALNPKHPGPPFFYGLALVRAGKFAEAHPWWVKALELVPEKASYRRELAMRLFALELLLQEQARRADAPSRDAGGDGEGRAAPKEASPRQSLP